MTDKKKTTKAELRKNIPATLKMLELAIDDAMKNPVDTLDTDVYLRRQARMLDTVSRILLAQSMEDPAKASAVMVNAALDASRLCGKTISRLHDIHIRQQMYDEEYGHRSKNPCTTD